MKGKVTKDLFSAVKILLENGATNKEAGKYMKLNPATISIIRNCESFKEYTNHLAEMALKNRNDYAKKKEAEKKANTVTTVTPVTPVTQQKEVVHEYPQARSVNIQIPWQLMQEMKKTNELLAGISNKLAFIVEELTGEVMKNEG